MAVTYEQQPTRTIIPAYNNIVYTLRNGAITQFFHKYILQIYIENNLVATLKASANEAGNGIFDISSVLQDYCSTDIDGFISSTPTGHSTLNGVTADVSQHAIHKIDAYASNKSNVKHFFVKATEEFATTATGSIIVQSTFTSQNKLVWNAAHQQENGFETFNEFDYVLSADTKNLLTGFSETINRKVRKTDYHTLAFFNGKFGSSAAQQSLPDKFSIKFYNNANVQQGSTINYDIDAAASNGMLSGALLNYPTFQTTFPALGYFGCGGKNITNNGGTIPAAATYYTVQAFNSSTEVSKLYRFDFIDDDCKGYNTIRLTYLNRLGAWDYYNFTKKSTKTTSTQRSVFKKTYGTWQNQSWDYGTYEGGVSSYEVNAVERIEANTDFITESEAKALEELFTSPQVFIQNDDGNFEPVVVTDNSYTEQTKANDMIIQYIIGIEKSNKKRIQTI